MKNPIWKNLMLFTAFLGLVLSCNQEKVNELEEESGVLKQQNQELEASINEMLSSFNKIQENLGEITKREGYIKYNSLAELEGGMEESINSDIRLISELMRENEAEIKRLNAALESSGIKMKEFRKLIENLNVQIADKNLEIAKLNDALEAKDFKIAELYFSIDSFRYANSLKDQEIQGKIDALNEAYYAIGTFKELKEKNVLTKEGGVLGVGRTEALKDNFNKEYFTRIDIKKQRAFLIYAKDAQLVTTHPTGSYEFAGSGDLIDSLVITQVEDFWRASKYLVIVTE